MFGSNYFPVLGTLHQANGLVVGDRVDVAQAIVFSFCARHMLEVLPL